jgi:hypothetical protein
VFVSLLTAQSAANNWQVRIKCNQSMTDSRCEVWSGAIGAWAVCSYAAADSCMKPFVFQQLIITYIEYWDGQ